MNTKWKIVFGILWPILALSLVVNVVLLSQSSHVPCDDPRATLVVASLEDADQIAGAFFRSASSLDAQPRWDTMVVEYHGEDRVYPVGVVLDALISFYNGMAPLCDDGKDVQARLGHARDLRLRWQALCGGASPQELHDLYSRINSAFTGLDMCFWETRYPPHPTRL